MDAAVSLIAKYGYFVIFPLAVVEGPIVTVASGFLASLGVLNLFAVYAIVVAGDVVGDTGLYLVGRWGGGRFLERFTGRSIVTEENLEKAKKYFELNGGRAITFSKLVHGMGIIGLSAAGSMKMPYKKYISICLMTTLVQYAILAAVGFLSGHAFMQINKYLNLFAAATFVAGGLAIFWTVARRFGLFSD